MTATAYIENGKWKIAVFAVAIVYFLLSPFAVYSAFEDSGTGARAAALGGTYVASGDDTFSLLYNAASLARIKQPEVATEYSRFYAGLTDGSNMGQYFLGYSYPFRRQGVMGLGWRQLSLDNLYTERTLTLGYGRWITTRLAAGVAFKQLFHSFAAPTIVVDDAGQIQSGTPDLFMRNGTSRSAYSGDLGLLYRLTPRWMLGFSIQDVNTPDVALSSSDQDTVPRTFRLGLAYQRPNGLGFAAAFSERDDLPDQTSYKGTGAVEKWWNQKKIGWAARGGFVLGTQELRQVSMGFGGRYSSLLIDYAFMFNLSGLTLGDTAGTHRFSLIYRLGSLKRKRSGHVSKPASGIPNAPTPTEEATAVLSISTSSVSGWMPFTLDVSTGGHHGPGL